MKHKILLAAFILLLSFSLGFSSFNANIVTATGGNFTETDTLQTVTDRGATTNNNIEIDHNFIKTTLGDIGNSIHNNGTLTSIITENGNTCFGFSCEDQLSTLNIYDISYKDSRNINYISSPWATFTIQSSPTKYWSLSSLANDLNYLTVAGSNFRIRAGAATNERRSFEFWSGNIRGAILNQVNVGDVFGGGLYTGTYQYNGLDGTQWPHTSKNIFASHSHNEVILGLYQNYVGGITPANVLEVHSVDKNTQLSINRDGHLWIGLRNNTANSNSKYIQPIAPLTVNKTIDNLSAYFNGNVEILQNLSVNGTIFADDFVTLSRVADFKSTQRSLDKLENVLEWRKADNSLDYDKHYAFTIKNSKVQTGYNRESFIEEKCLHNDKIQELECYNETIVIDKPIFEDVEIKGLSMETRVAEMEKMIWELHQETQRLQSEINTLKGVRT